MNVFIAHCYCQHFGLKPHSSAGFTGLYRHKLFIIFSDRSRVRFVIFPVHVGHYSRPWAVIRIFPRSAFGRIRKLNLRIARTFPNDGLYFFGELVQGRIKRKIELGGEGFKPHPVPIGFGIIRNKNALIKRKALIGGYQVLVEVLSHSESRTFGAGPYRVIKRKKAGLQFGHRNTAIRTGIFLRKENLGYGRILIVLSCSKQGSAGTFQGRFHRFRKAFPHILRQPDSVYDYFDCVFFLFIKLYPVFEVYK